MTTRSGFFIDVLLEIADLRAFVTAMNTAAPDYWNTELNWFAPGRVGAQSLSDVAKTEGCTHIRMHVDDWADMNKVRPPMRVLRVTEKNAPS